MVNTRRRTTLGPISTNRRASMMGGPLDNSNANSNNNNRDGLSKNNGNSSKPRKQRMSMIPRMTGSLTPAKTTSTGRKSMGGGSNHYHQSPHHSHSRPSSIPPPTTMRTDTRPISDKTYFNTCVRKLHAYLEQNNYEHPIKLKDLTRPSAKDFHNIMVFLLSKIDVTFYHKHANSSNNNNKEERGERGNNNNNNPKRKFEDDVSLIFRTLGYPFNISKTALVAAGSPHTWPSLLLAITWLIELLTSISNEFLYEDDIVHNTQYDNGNEDYNIFDEVDEKNEQPLLNDNKTLMEDLNIIEQRFKIGIHLFTERSYGSFLSGDDDMYLLMENQLVEYVERDIMLIEQAYERTTDENGVILEQMTEIEKEFEDLPAHQNRLEVLANDLETFHELVKQLNEHRNMQAEKVQERDVELKVKEAEIEKTEQRIRNLVEKIATQEYSIEDVYQLEREKAQFEESVAQTLSKRQEQESLTLNGELELKKELERLKRLVAPYNENIKDLPTDDSMKTQISIDKRSTHEKDIKMLLGNVDLKEKILPFLRKTFVHYTDETGKNRSESYEGMNRQVKSEEELMEHKDQVEVISELVKRAEKTYANDIEEHGATLSLRQEEVKILEEKVETLRDPTAAETVMSKYHSQINDLESLSKQHQEGDIARKQAVLAEFNEALRVCSEYKIYRERELKLLQNYLNSLQQMDIALSNEEEKILSS